jgi:hypothetical protein
MKVTSRIFSATSLMPTYLTREHVAQVDLAMTDRCCRKVLPAGRVASFFNRFPAAALGGNSSSSMSNPLHG